MSADNVKRLVVYVFIGLMRLSNVEGCLQPPLHAVTHLCRCESIITLASKLLQTNQYLFILQTYLWNTNAAKSYPMYIAEEKTQGPFGSEILRAFWANYLVCLAMWQATAAQDIIGKIFGIFFPVLCFVAIGFSHTVWPSNASCHLNLRPGPQGIFPQHFTNVVLCPSCQLMQCLISSPSTPCLGVAVC